MVLIGKIRIGEFGENSKSSYSAVFLDVDNNSYVLRLKGENPFELSNLKELNGKFVIAEGNINSYLFLAEKVTEKKQ